METFAKCNKYLFLFQGHRLLEVQEPREHAEGVQDEPADCHRLQAARLRSQLLLQVHLLQKGKRYLASCLILSIIVSIYLARIAFTLSDPSLSCL